MQCMTGVSEECVNERREMTFYSSLLAEMLKANDELCPAVSFPESRELDGNHWDFKKRRAAGVPRGPWLALSQIINNACCRPYP